MAVFSKLLKLLPAAVPTIDLSTLLLLPILAFISVPLIISAWFTICFSVIALSIRVFVIYVELIYAVVSSYFVIPFSAPPDDDNDLSLLNFSVSGPPSPNYSSLGERSVVGFFGSGSGSSSALGGGAGGYPSYGQYFDTGLKNSSSRNRRNRGSAAISSVSSASPSSSSSSTLAPTDLVQDSVISNGNGNGDQSTVTDINTITNIGNISRPWINRSNSEGAVRRHSAFTTLVSGDERQRDFEDMGGWRCCGTSRRYQNRSQSAISSSSSSSCSSSSSTANNDENDDNAEGENDDVDDVDADDDDPEERSWLSINNRLELPSQRRMSLLASDFPNSSNINDSELRICKTSPSTPPIPIPSGERRHRRAATMFAYSSSSRNYYHSH